MSAEEVAAARKKYAENAERLEKSKATLEELKQLHLEHKRTGGPLAGLSLFTKARLSVMPVTKEEWDFIISLESSN